MQPILQVNKYKVPIKIICTNKKAYHDFTIDTTFEAGMILTGPEVKSLRAGRANLRDGYATIERQEVWLHHVHISPYSHATDQTVDPLRTRKLLLHKREIRKLLGKIREKGFALVPLKIYFAGNSKIKVELGLARGKKLYDKRDALKKKQSDRDMERENRKK